MNPLPLSTPPRRRWWVGFAILVIVGFATVGGATPQGGGGEPYRPTRLDWLVLQLNAKDRLQNPFGSGLVEYRAAGPDTVVMRLLSSSVRLGQDGMKDLIRTTRKVIAAEAEIWGFQEWVRIRESVLDPGVSLR